MTGREELSEEKPKVKMLSPGFGIDKSRLHGSGFRSKGFAITDLLGLESDLQVRQQPGGPPGSGLSVAGSGPGSEPQGPGGGLGGFSFPGGSLPLGLGFLCSLAAQQPAGAPCFLPGHLPLLQARADSHYLQNLEAQRDAYSGTAQLGSGSEPFYSFVLHRCLVLKWIHSADLVLKLDLCHLGLVRFSSVQFGLVRLSQTELNETFFSSSAQLLVAF